MFAKYSPFMDLPVFASDPFFSNHHRLCLSPSHHNAFSATVRAYGLIPARYAATFALCSASVAANFVAPFASATKYR
jgi:hypothetical protein